MKIIQILTTIMLGFLLFVSCTRIEKEISSEQSTSTATATSAETSTALPTDEGGTPTEQAISTVTVTPAEISTVVPTTEEKQSLEGYLIWVKQFGTQLSDEINAMISDAQGNVYILGVLGEETDYGMGTFQELLKFNPGGEILWAQPIGKNNGNNLDLSLAINDGGDIYTGGRSGAELFSASFSSEPTIIRKFDPSGKLIWASDLLEGQCTGLGDIALGMNGDIYAAGSKRKGRGCGEDYYAFIEGFNKNGESLWTINLGSEVNGLTLIVIIGKESSFYLASHLLGTHGEAEIFLGRYSSQGDAIWTNQYGSTGNDFILDAVSDAMGNVYLLYRNEIDYAFLTKIDSEGNQIWLNQLSTRETRAGGGNLALDKNEIIYVLLEYKSLSKETPAEVHKIDSQGNLLWTRYFPHTWHISPAAMVVDSAGNIYIGGKTYDALPGGAEYGHGDVFLLKMVP